MQGLTSCLPPAAVSDAVSHLMPPPILHHMRHQTDNTVQRNRAGLEEVMKQLKAQILTADKAMAAFAAKYKIRFVGSGDDDEGAGSSKPKQASGAGGSSSKGVLA
jgi:hypothetical protein